MRMSHIIQIQGADLHCGTDLIIGSEADCSVRKAALRLYEDSLEHICYAVVLGDRITVSGDVLKNRAAAGGQLLFEHFGSEIDQVETRTTLTVEEVIHDQQPGLWRLVKDDLQRIDSIYQFRKEVWNSWISREAAICLGDDLSLWGGNPNNFVFNTKPRPYLRNDDLEGTIGEDAMTGLVQAINKPLTNPKRIPDAALSAFVRRATLTHVAVLNWYEHCMSDMMNEGVRGNAKVPSFSTLLFPTRESIVNARPQVTPYAHRIQQVLSPHMLLLALRQTARREKFFESLKNIRESKPFSDLRGRLREAIAEPNKWDTPQLAALWSEINNHAIKIDQDAIVEKRILDGATVSASGVGVGLTSGTFDRLGRRLFPKRYIVEDIVRTRTDVAQREIHARLKELCVELS
jgi:hypothetical protein